MTEKKFLTKKEASKYLTEVLGLAISEKTLSKYITKGGSPEYQKFGRRVVYTIDTLDAWVEKKLSTPATSSSNLL